jgi:hypothetical protein
LNQEDVNHINRSITFNEIEAGMKNLLKKKSPGPDRFTAKIYQICKEELIPKFLNLFHKIEKKVTLPHTLIL